MHVERPLGQLGSDLRRYPGDHGLSDFDNYISNLKLYNLYLNDQLFFHFFIIVLPVVLLVVLVVIVYHYRLKHWHFHDLIDKLRHFVGVDHVFKQLKRLQFSLLYLDYG